MSVDTHRPKGKYAKYKIKKLSPTHLDILEALNEAGEAMTSRALEEPVKKRRHARGEKGIIKQPQITGRLSEMGRIGLVKMWYAEVQVVDEKIPSFRFRKTPVWAITEKGREALNLGKIPHIPKRRQRRKKSLRGEPR